MASCEEEILEDESVKLVAAAAITSERCALGLRSWITEKTISPTRLLYHFGTAGEQGKGKRNQQEVHGLLQ